MSLIGKSKYTTGYLRVLLDCINFVMGIFRGIVEIIKPVRCLKEGLKTGKGQGGWNQEDGETGLGK